jgi:protein phosphatase
LVEPAAARKVLDAKRLSMRENNDIFSDQIRGARERQEDSVSHRSFDDGRSLLVLLADGMGGHQGGEVASRTSIDVFTSAFLTDFSALKMPYRLFGSLERANKELEAISKKSVELEGMGSTLIAATVSSAGLHWVSVGDSLLFRIRRGRIQRLNEDHSMAPLLDEAVKKGTLTREQAAEHKDRNALRSAVSGGPIDLVDVSDRPEQLRKGDVVLLASDGLLTLTDRDIVRLVIEKRSAGAEAVVKELLNAVREKNKRRQDNTTVAAIVIERSTNSAERLRRSPILTWVLAMLVGGSAAIVAIGLAAGHFSTKSIVSAFTVISGDLKGLELPSLPGRGEESATPQPIDLSEPIPSKSNLPPNSEASTPPVTVKRSRSGGRSEEVSTPGPNREDINALIKAEESTSETVAPEKGPSSNSGELSIKPEGTPKSEPER